MFSMTVWAQALVPMFAFALLGWLLSLIKKNVAIVDSMWALFFLLAGISYASVSGARVSLTLLLLSLWALRLALYITARNWGHGEDPRYQAIRRRNEPGFAVKSLWLVFGLQALLAWVISLPLLGAILSPAPQYLNVLDYLGAAIWSVGLFFETVGDWQLARFKKDPANQGQVMDRGLWRYTRHPNYFGDFCVWWGFYLIALAGGAWWSIVGPIVMSTLLLRVSGVTLLEKDIGKRRPGYAEYVARTSAFFPRPPRARAPSAAI